MAGYTSLPEAMKAGDVKMIELTRREARAIDGFDSDVSANLLDAGANLVQAVDEAQGEADEAGKAVYVVLKINGGPL